MIDPRPQGRHDSIAARRVSQANCKIAQPAFMPDPRNGAARKAFAKPRLVPSKQFHQFGPVQPVSHPKIGFAARIYKAIPRAYPLAVVTTINAIADQWTQ